MDGRAMRKLREARRLATMTPERSLAIGFELMRFSRSVSEAADRAQL